MLGQLKATFRSAPQHDDEPKVESILKKSRFNFYQEYVEGVQRRKMEEMKNDSILQERLTQETERDLMESEEQLSWNAYELPLRNRMRLIKRHLDTQRQAKETRLRRLKDEVRLKEEGLPCNPYVLSRRQLPSAGAAASGGGGMWASPTSARFEAMLRADTADAADTTDVPVAVVAVVAAGAQITTRHLDELFVNAHLLLAIIVIDVVRAVEARTRDAAGVIAGLAAVAGFDLRAHLQLVQTTAAIITIPVVAARWAARAA